MTKAKLTKLQESIIVHLHEHPGDDIASMATAQKVSESAVKKTLTELCELGFISGPPSLSERCADVLREMDKDFGPTSESYAEAIVLIASIIEDASETALSENLGFDSEFVHLVGSRLRAAGIWRGKELNPAAIDTWSKDGVSFYMDVNVAAGKFRVVGDYSENRQYQMTESGLRDGAALIKRMSP